MKKLRLVTTLDCYRFCEGCCNHDWDWSKVPVCRSFVGYDEILLTGGEPMLDIHKLVNLILDIKYKNQKAKIYIYTAETSDYVTLTRILYTLVDGLTITLHKNSDVRPFAEFASRIEQLNNHPYFPLKLNDKSLRLNIFKEVTDEFHIHDRWIVKKNMEWIPQCPLPEGEIMMKLPGV